MSAVPNDLFDTRLPDGEWCIELMTLRLSAERATVARLPTAMTRRSGACACVCFGGARVGEVAGFPRFVGAVPNPALQQTGHANEASARHYGFSRVSRLLSWLFGEGGDPLKGTHEQRSGLAISVRGL